MPPAVDSEPDPIDAAVQLLFEGQATHAERDGRIIRLLQPVKGDPGFFVLRAIGFADAANPVGAAAHGPGGVAAGVWRQPDLYLARWTTGGRRVAGYRLPSARRPHDYISIEGRIPTRFETGNWYAGVPDGVAETFFEVGFLLDEPPFDPPAVSPPKPPPAAASRAAPRERAPKATAGGGRPRPDPAPRPQKAPPPKSPVATTRVCPECRMQKALLQFSGGNDLCVDCR